MNKEIAQLLLVYMILEYLWISNMTPMLYERVFSNIQQKPMTIQIQYAFMAYILLLFSIVYICIPLSKQYSSWYAFSIVGLCMYGIYNATNAAVFSGYPLRMVVIDTLWGLVCFTLLGIFYSKIKDVS